MATVQQPHPAPRRPPPSPPPVLPPPLARPPSTAAGARPQLPCKRGRAGVAGSSSEERVADSCCPTELVVIDSDSDSEDDDGCGSCVYGGESCRGQDREEEAVSGSVVAWWSQESSSRRCFPWAKQGRTGEHQHAGGEPEDDDDPKVAAARRQEEDRKFWEACLASGYP